MIKIGNVSYVNSYPFQYGLDSNSDFEIFKLVPSAIANALENDEIDVGLVPLAAFIQHKNWVLLSDFCIGAMGEVKTVLLLSKKQISEVKTICFDLESRSSNMLTKVLCKNYWKINPNEAPLKNADACVMIGDKAFQDYSEEYKYRYDLSQEWYNYAKLPFVFAVWVSNKPLFKDDVRKLNDALQFGVEHIDESIEKYKSSMKISPETAKDYLTQNISYPLDDEKRKAIELFTKLSESIK